MTAEHNEIRSRLTRRVQPMMYRAFPDREAAAWASRNSFAASGWFVDTAPSPPIIPTKLGQVPQLTVRWIKI